MLKFVVEIGQMSKKSVTVEKHSWWKELKKTIDSEVGDIKEVESEDDELKMTQVEVNTICPISRKEMVEPVKIDKIDN